MTKDVDREALCLSGLIVELRQERSVGEFMPVYSFDDYELDLMGLNYLGRNDLYFLFVEDELVGR